jgi:two-component system chemotaxis response regulator CheY
MRTLIVEDDSASRFFLEKILSPYGRCDSVSDGKQALEVFKLGWDDGNSHDLIVLDIMLPGMDGLEVLHAIREIEAERGRQGPERVKVIMATALSSPKDIFMAASDECDGYFVKPLDRHMIIEKVKEIGLIP